MENKRELFSEIIRREFSRHNLMYSYKEKQMIEEGKFKTVASKQLDKTRKYSWVVIISILFFSGWSIYQFIDFGRSENVYSLVLGVCMWIVVVMSTYLFTKEIVAKKESMKFIIQLLDKKQPTSK